MRAVFLKILGFVVVITSFYGGIGQLWLTQSEEHPAAELQITVDTDTDALVGMGETLLRGKGGCLLCHKITEQGNTRGPDLRGVGGRAAAQRPGLDAAAYLTESLVDPGAYVVAEFATAGGASIMPAADRPPAELSPTELKALVAYLQSLGGEITVEITAADVAAAEAGKKQPASGAVTAHPGAALLAAQGCVACHDITGEMRLVGPPLTGVGERLSAAEIRQSIVDPDAVIAEGFFAGLMLQDFGEKLTAEELDQIVSYLSGEVSLGERLSHPAVHLAVLILLFNGGVLLAFQWAPSPAAPGASGVSVAADSDKRWRRPAGLLLGAMALGVLVYLAIQTRSLEPPAEQPAAAPIAPTPQRPAEPPPAAPPEPAAQVTAAAGRTFYMQSCVACHGADAKGVPGLGKDMTTSEFIRSLSDAELVQFIKRGRAPDDPLNTTGVPMPPMGANPALTDADLLAIVEFIRSLGD